MRIESAGTARTVAVTIADAVSGRRPVARRLFDARARRDHAMGPRDARIVYGRDLDAGTLEPLRYVCFAVAWMAAATVSPTVLSIPWVNRPCAASLPSTRLAAVKASTTTGAMEKMA